MRYVSRLPLRFLKKEEHDALASISVATSFLKAKSLRKDASSSSRERRNARRGAARRTINPRQVWQWRTCTTAVIYFRGETAAAALY